MRKQRSLAAARPRFGFLARLQSFRLNLGSYIAEAIGILLLAAALLTLLGLLGLTEGTILTPWIGLLRRWLGWGAVLVVLTLASAGWRLLIGRRTAYGFAWGRVVAEEMAAFSALGLLSLFLGQSLETAEAGDAGGLVGWGLVESLRLLFGSFLPDWLAVFIVGFLLVAVFLLAGLSSLRQTAWLRSSLASPGKTVVPVTPPVLSISPVGEKAEEPSSRQRSTRIPAEFRKDFRVEKKAARPSKPIRRSADLPPLDLLAEEQSSRPDERHINQMAGLLEKTLAEFGIPARVVGFQVGPTVTQFHLEPGYIEKAGDEDSENRQKVRVAQISALQRDLALALSAQRLRIQAPVPGRSYVGVEVPNSRTSLVRLCPILESQPFQKLGSPLGMALGRDVSGAPIAADLSKMPHLLVAGTTGSGKSVLISAIAICLVMNNSPEDLRLVMIDPKMVELVRFNGLPHLLGKVETELERINAVLRWVVAEMQRRYKLLEAARARDIESYNQKAARKADDEHLPRIVVLIDELADLMMSTAEHTEATLVRLAQMARATGIHLVVATQRPSTDVVTGLIKANFPARISFAVASSIDSRVILDTTGAESLLGRGDMLYLAPEAAAPLRSQGVMITDQEIEAVIDYWQQAWELEEPEAAPWDGLMQKEAWISDKDELIERAIEEIRRTGKSSASHLQRALRIGYPRAARLVDELEEMGVLGPVQSGGREREVLMNLDDFSESEEGEE
ncbi:MAG: DNA translocase FtsK [Chloroflexi bacterium]|nr:DNA translocase FtsK [Chloroflexota bacterium]